MGPAFFEFIHFLIKFVSACFRMGNNLSGRRFEDYAQALVLDNVGVPVCGFPVAEEVFLSPLGCVCIFP